MNYFFPTEDHNHEYGVVETFISDPNDDPKNIVISFDGTGGNPGWAVQRGNEDRYGEVTGLGNCCKLHLLAGGNIGNTNYTFNNPDQLVQLPLYYSGVGTRGYTRHLKSVMGLGAMKDIYTTAYEDLEKIYRKDDKIFVFGFSRGAATARLFCSYLFHNPIRGVVPQVAFLGVFDTVCESIPIGGGVGTSDAPSVLDVNGEDGSLPGNVARAVHLVSIDDYRGPFTPTLFNDDPRVTEVWCPGVHSDIGGGYYHDGLSDLALVAMKIEAEKAGLICREITRQTIEESHHTIVARGADPQLDARSFSNFDNDMQIEPNCLDREIHNTMSLMYSTLNFFKRFVHRKPRKLKDNEDWDGEPILLLDGAVERVRSWDHTIPDTYVFPDLTYSVDNAGRHKYRPQCLVGVPYKVVSSEDMSVSDTVHNCITDEVDEW